MPARARRTGTPGEQNLLTQLRHQREPKRYALAGLGEAYAGLLIGWLTSDGHELVSREETLDSALDLPDDVILIAGSKGLPDGSAALYDAAETLRLKRFRWHPILLVDVTAPPSVPAQWAIWSAEQYDEDAVRQAIRVCAALPEERREDVVRSAVQALYTDMVQLAHSGDASDGPESAAVALALGPIIQAAKEAPQLLYLESVQPFVDHIDQLCERPSLSRLDLDELLGRAVETEHAVREAEPGSELGRLIHSLKTWCANQAQDIELGKRALGVLSTLALLPTELVAAVCPGAAAPLRTLGASASAIPVRPSSEAANGLQALLRSRQGELAAIGQALRDARGRRGEYLGEDSFARILVLEDDAAFRQQVVAVLASMDLPDSVAVVEADSAQAARDIMGAGEVRTLALVNLRLPEGPEAGIELVREFMPQGTRHQFMVLTAAQSHTAAVRLAQSLGVTPRDYIHKVPGQWESQLRSRVHLALTEHRRARVAVLQSTRSVIWVDGVEVTLTAKPFIVFEHLAEGRGRNCLVEAMCDVLSIPGTARTLGETVSAKQIQDCVYEVREAIREAMERAGRSIDPAELVRQNKKPPGYSLNAQITLYEHFDDIPLQAAQGRVLVVEDLPDWSRSIADALAAHGFAVAVADTLEAALQRIRSDPPDLVSLDLQFPRDAGSPADEANALEFLRVLSEECPNARVAVLTSLAFDDDLLLKVSALGVRHWNYICKHWDSSRERLVSAMDSLWTAIERGAEQPPAGEPGHLHTLRYSPERRVLSVDDVPVNLSPGQDAVVSALAHGRLLPVSKADLIELIWPAQDGPGNPLNTIEQRINDIRTNISQTAGIDGLGAEVLRSSDGAYWLHGRLLPVRD